VLASNNNEVWNKLGASLTFYILPAEYQTMWFRFAAAILAGAAIWLLFAYRLKQETAVIRMRLGERLVERERIARELHDTLLQGFQGLMLSFHAVLKQLPHPEVARAMMDRALRRGDDVMREGRMRVRDLRSEIGTTLELPKALAGFGQTLAETSSIVFDVQVTGVIQALNPICRDELESIIREALSNAFLHSHASKIELKISYAPLALRILVVDDGRSIDEGILKGGRTDHWGLSGMRERAETIGAKLSIRSSEGCGTDVDLLIAGKLVYAKFERQSVRHFLRAMANRLRQS